MNSFPYIEKNEETSSQEKHRLYIQYSAFDDKELERELREAEIQEDYDRIDVLSLLIAQRRPRKPDEKLFDEISKRVQETYSKKVHKNLT